MGRPKGAMGKQKKPKDPNKPKRAQSAYFFFIGEKRREAQKAGHKITKVAQWTKEVAAIWKDFPDEDKTPYEKLAAADKSRYEKEMLAYSGKRPKDDNKPKRPQSAYFLFLASFREKKKSSFEGMPNAHKELIRKAGETWNKLTPEEKKPFELLAEKEKESYEERMKEYNQGLLAPKKARVEAAAVNEEEDEEEDEEEEEEEEDDE